MDLSAGGLFAGVLFGALGVASWQIGRRRDSARKMLAGFALLGFMFVTPAGWPTWVVGLGLTAVAFWPE